MTVQGVQPGKERLDEDVVQDFEVETHRPGTEPLVVVRGEVDLTTAPLLRAVLDGITAQRPGRVEVDLSAVNYMDSQGLLTLIAARRRLASHGGTLAVRSRQGFLRRVFEATGLDHVFELEDAGQTVA